MTFSSERSSRFLVRERAGSFCLGFGGGSSSLGFFVVGHLSLVVKMVFLDGFFSLLFESSDLWVVEVFVAPVCIRWVF